MQIAELFVKITSRVDRGTLNQSMGEIRRSADTTRNTLKNLFVGVAFVNEMRKAVSAAADLEQAVGGTAAVFGDASGIIDEFAETSATTFGISQRAARELTSQIGGLLKGFGFTQQEAAETSVHLAQLGADLAATFGGRPEEAVRALGAALRGETDPIERFGIAINQQAVNLKAVELGLAETTSQVSQSAKAQATLALIYERSGDAAGQFAREQGTASGSAATLAAQMEDLRAELGDALLPTVSKVTGFISTMVSTFAGMPEVVQNGVLALAGLAVVVGPINNVIKSTRELIGVSGQLGTKLASMGVTGGRAALAMGGLGIVLAGATLIYQNYARDKQIAKERTDEFVAALQAEAEGQEGAMEAALANQLASEKTSERLELFGLSYKQVGDYIRGETVPAVEALLNRTEMSRTELEALGLNASNVFNYGGEAHALSELIFRLGTAYGAATEEVNAYNEAEAALSDDSSFWTDFSRGAIESTAAAGDATTAIEDTTTAVDDLAESLEDSVDAARDEADAMREAADAILATIDARRSAADSHFAMNEAQRSFVDAQQQYADVLADGDADIYDHAEALDGVAQAASTAADAAVRYATDSFAANGVTLSAAQTGDIWRRSILEQAAAVDGPMREAILAHVSRMEGIPPEVVSQIDALLNEGKLDEATRLLDEASATRDAEIQADALTAAADAGLDDVASRERVAELILQANTQAADEGLEGVEKEERVAEIVGQAFLDDVTGQFDAVTEAQRTAIINAILGDDEATPAIALLTNAEQQVVIDALAGDFASAEAGLGALTEERRQAVIDAIRGDFGNAQSGLSQLTAQERRALIDAIKGDFGSAQRGLTTLTGTRRSAAIDAVMGTDYATGSINNIARNRTVTITTRHANVAVANGGIIGYESYAPGGMRGLPSQAKIQPAGTVVQWAEPETGGEAFIPLALSKRKNSIAIWRQVGRILGALNFAEGGMTYDGGPAYANFPDITPTFDVRVFVGNKELTDIVRTEFHQRDMASRAGRRF